MSRGWRRAAYGRRVRAECVCQLLSVHSHLLHGRPSESRPGHDDDNNNIILYVRPIVGLSPCPKRIGGAADVQDQAAGAGERDQVCGNETEPVRRRARIYVLL